MNKFDIFTDSGCNVPDEISEKYGICIIPYIYTVNGVEKPCYEKGTPFKDLAKEFYARLRAGTETKTSLISEASFEEYLIPSLQAGRDVILFTISAGVS